jgi:hypothetical protein
LDDHEEQRRGGSSSNRERHLAALLFELNPITAALAYRNRRKKTKGGWGS